MKKEHFFASLMVMAALKGDPNTFQLYDKQISKLIKSIIQPQGRISTPALKDLQDLGKLISSHRKLTLNERDTLLSRITRLLQDLPTASKILGNGLDIKGYESWINTLRKISSKYAQPLLDLKVATLQNALNILIGNSAGKEIIRPNPFDAAYEQLVDDYIDWALKFEKLESTNTLVTEYRKFAQDFATQFDRMLTINDLGREKKRQLIQWLGGPEKYLGIIIGQKLR